MNIMERVVEAQDIVTKSNLPTCDYVINPFVGCPHACKYCYACFMKRFTKHEETWGTFIDVKRCDKPINAKRLEGKRVFLSSVTDCYNPFEKKYQSTRKILEQLAGIDCRLSISTKSSLILRDIALLKQCRNVKAAVSLNTLDEQFRRDMDCADSIADRLHTLKTLYDSGIYTVLFLSPIFPGITDCKEIIDSTKEYVCEYWFENLNLRGSYRAVIMNYISECYPRLFGLYDEIYRKRNMNHWEELAAELADYCRINGIQGINYFYHKI